MHHASRSISVPALLAIIAALASPSCGTSAPLMGPGPGENLPEPVRVAPAERPASDALERLRPSPAVAPLPRSLADSLAQLSAAVDSFFQLAGSPRRFIHTDKTLYQPGETVWFRLWELGGARADIRTRAKQPLTIELLDPKGIAVVKKTVQVKDGVARGDVRLAADALGGKYTLKLQSQHKTVSKSLTVSSYRTPQIKKRLEFLRSSYRAGDRVELAVQLARATGAPLARQGIRAIVTLGGVERERISATTGADGRALISFALPASIGDGSSSVTVLVDAGGVVESAQKAIPIQRDELELSFYPEGGQLITGLPGRVYFTARMKNGRPARVTGRVLDDRGRALATLESSYRGMGRFAFTPRAGRLYRAEVTLPSGQLKIVQLPIDSSTGCVLRALDEQNPERPVVRMGVWCTEDRTIIAQVTMREQHLGNTAIAVVAHSPHLVEMPVPEARRHDRGAVRFTVFDERLQPLAERLVYRDFAAHSAPGGRGGLQVTMRTSRATYLPRDEVELLIDTRDSHGQPIAADLSLSVVDDSALALSHDQSPSLPAAYLLVSELTQPRVDALDEGALIDLIGDPDFYFSTDERAAGALDLVLGTYGWRRFVWKYVLAPDSDHDRILDMDDMCPMDPETYNGIDDEDGCPDRGLVRIVNNKIEIRDPNAVAPLPPPKPRPVIGDPRAIAPEKKARAINPRAGWFRQGGAVFAPVREFPTIVHRPDRKGPRRDFRETVFFSPSVRTNQRGRARVRFVLSDAVTSFRATAQGVSQPIATEHGQQIIGQLGHAELLIAAKRPLTAALTLPLEMTVGDRLSVPITLANDSGATLSADIRAQFGAGFAVERTLPTRTALAPGARQTVYAHLRARAPEHNSGIRVAVSAAGLVDDLQRQVTITPAGYPFQRSAAGTLRIDGARRRARTAHSFALYGALPGSVTATVTAYPSPVATMLKGADALVREPHGCFEQASSSNYPNVLVMQYLQEHGVADPDLTARTREMLDRGYRKLVGYESPKRGYEWFGGDPGHEALTAYGLLEFTDMAQVFAAVEPAMLARTEAWLLKRRTGRGGFARNERALDSFGRASADVTDAYVTYALGQSIRARVGADLRARKRAAGDLKVELAHQRALAGATSDPYILALAARTLVTLEPERGAGANAIRKLVALQAEDGSFPGADHSVTRSGGKNLLIETTALSLLALMEAGNRYESNIRKSVAWLRGARSGTGSFGTTQATVLALQALTAYARHARAQAADGALLININGRVAHRVALAKDSREPVVIGDLGRFFRAGDNRVALEYRGSGSVPFSIAVAYRGKEPAPGGDSPVRVATVLSRASAPVGEPVTLRATVENRSASGLPMVLARVGIPGGLRFQPAQLDELRKRGLVDFVETRPREIMLYWRSMQPRGRKALDIELLSAVPGTFTGPASQVYLYYDDERRHFAPPLRASVTANQ